MAASQKLISTCDQGDTIWNRQLIGYHLRYWISSIDIDNMKSPYDFIVDFKYRVKPPKSKEEETRLDFIVKLDSETGKVTGPAWKNFGYRGPRYHDGYLYGKIDENHELTGDSIAFIYPDFETALLGTFINGTMMSAKPTRIVAERCKNGIKHLKFAKPAKNAPVLKYQRPDFIRPGDQPQVADPFERKVIYIAKGVYQDGVFARRDIRIGELIAYYAGMMFDTKKHPIFFHNQTNSDRYAAHRNLIGLGKDDFGNMIQINLPEPYWNTTNYRSTLGHKVNHNFVKIKAQFNFATHPRFGWVRTLTAIEDIYAGEEIFIHYHYPIKASSNVPMWYKELYEEQVGPWPKLKKGEKPPVNY